MNQVQDDEIDLFELIQTLWDGKRKIIATTFVAAVVGVIFSVVKPNSFEVSTTIQSGKQSVFVQYLTLNELLKNEGLLYEKETNPNGYIFDSASLFKLFTNEFNDYKEMTFAVGKSELVQEAVKDLDDADKQRALLNFAKQFKLNAPTKNRADWTISFVWHDELEGSRLVNDAILDTLSTIKDRSIADIKDLASAIVGLSEQKLETLRNNIILIEQSQINSNKRRIQYLTEHSAIANELGIETNLLNANALSQSSLNAISLNVNSNSNDITDYQRSFSDVPYYLRGYKAIDKEITLIKSRSVEENLLAADGYIEIKNKILELEKGLASVHLTNASETIANDNPNDWVDFDLAIADVKSQKKSMLYVVLSILLGGMIGVMYVLISSAVRKRKASVAAV